MQIEQVFFKCSQKIELLNNVNLHLYKARGVPQKISKKFLFSISDEKTRRLEFNTRLK